MFKVKEETIHIVTYVVDDLLSLQRSNDGQWYFSLDNELTAKSSKEVAKHLRKIADTLTGLASKLEGEK